MSEDVKNGNFFLFKLYFEKRKGSSFINILFLVTNSISFFPFSHGYWYMAGIPRLFRTIYLISNCHLCKPAKIYGKYYCQPKLKQF